MKKKRERKATALLLTALGEAGASDRMNMKAAGGHYHDYDTSSPTPITDLVRDAQGEGLDALAARAMAGEFDGWPMGERVRKITTLNTKSGRA